jgi:undecaprenyl-diphosphatase
MATTMNVGQAIALGIVEGLTEYLPVSSTGHLILTQRMLGIPKSEASDAFAICIQSGAILAVAGLYWKRLLQMSRGTLLRLGGRRDDDADAGWALARNILVAFLPAAVVGVFCDDWIERVLFGLWYVVIAWLVGGAAILVVARWRRRQGGQQRGQTVEQLSWRAALVIGLIQCLAMWPGTSRSLVTIVGGMLVGLSLAAAVEFSFLLGVVTLLAATAYKLKDAGPIMAATYGWGAMTVGSLAAWVSAVLAVKWMVAYLKRHGMELFGYYRVLLAVLTAWGIWRGWLLP